MNLDISIFNFINNLSTHSVLLGKVGIFLAAYLQYVLGAVLVILLFYPKNKREINRPMVAVALISSLIARFLIKTLILLVYARPRPYVVLAGVHKLIRTFPYEDYQSFPSGHTVFFFAMAAAVYCFNKKLGLWFFLGASAIAVARIFVGVHWPSDIIGGVIIGTLTGWLAYRFYFINKLTFDRIILGAFKKLRL
jgi:undecaprenyl-diphosphatase